MEQQFQLGKERISLANWQRRAKSLPFEERMSFFANYIRSTKEALQNTCSREVLTAHDRVVTIRDPFTGEIREMLMFASNNYLGLARHPYVCEKVREAVSKYGVGVGGPPLLNGYTHLTRTLEERLASWKHQESAMIFSSGFSANVGLLQSIARKDDLILYDELSHASFLDGLKPNRRNTKSFGHNNLKELEIFARSSEANTMFAGVEGVYSMDGDCAPLNEFIHICKRHGLISICDDAHGTGILGVTGAGTAEYFGCAAEIDISMGTFSKAFAVTGGFIAASRDIIEFFRYHARPYVFSASLPPPILAAVLAGIDVVEQESSLRVQLRSNVSYAADLLRAFGLVCEPDAGIICLKVPEGINIRRASYQFHQLGIFVNAIEYPAVPAGSERFRFSLMAQHTRQDLDRLAEAVHMIWNNFE